MTDRYVDYATIIDPSEAPSEDRLDGVESKRDQMSRISRANTLNWNGKWRDEKKATKQNATSVVESVAGQLSLTPFQKERAVRVYEDLPDSFDTAYSTGMMALVICGLVGREDGRNYHPNQLRPDDPSETTEFLNIANDVGASYTSFYSCWKRIERKM